MLKAGDVVVVTVNGEPLGLELEEFWPYEPSAYVWDPAWLAVPIGEEHRPSGFIYSIHESGRVERATISAESDIGRWELVGDHDLVEPEPDFYPEEVEE